MRHFVLYLGFLLYFGSPLQVSADDKEGKVTLGDEKGMPFVELSTKIEGEKPSKDECYALYILLAPKDGSTLNDVIAQSGGALQLFFDRASGQVGYFGRMHDKETDKFVGYLFCIADKDKKLIRDSKAIKLSLEAVLEQTQEKLNWKLLGAKAKISAAVGVTRRDKVGSEGFVRFATPVVVADAETPKAR